MVKDVVTGKALLLLPRESARNLPGLRVSPMGMVRGKWDKVREIHDLALIQSRGRTVGQCHHGVRRDSRVYYGDGDEEIDHALGGLEEETPIHCRISCSKRWI